MNGNNNSGVFADGVGVKVEEEETLGQLRDRLALASARASVPGPRAPFVHIKVEDTVGEGAGGGGGEDATDGECPGAGEEEEHEEEEEQGVEEVEEEAEEDEEEEGQQREQYVDAGANDVAPPRRARPPPGSYADTDVDYDEEEEDDDEDVEEEWGEDDEEEEENEEWGGDDDKEAVLRIPPTRESGTISKGGSEVRPQRLPPGARSVPGSPRARLRTSGWIVNNAVQDNDVQQPEEEGEDEEEEEAGSAPDGLRKRGGGGHTGASRFTGVSWDKERNKWRAQCKGKYLGLHTTEEAAAHAYNKYLKDGTNPIEHRGGNTSHFKGVSWDKSKLKWRADCKGTKLGDHATEDDAARAVSKYREDGIDPAQHREASTSQFKGVSWDKSMLKWRAECKGARLGCHATEEDAAHALNKFIKDGIDRVDHREARTSQFAGVSWAKSASKWRAKCKGTRLGYHATEEGAVRAYNKYLEDGSVPVKHRDATNTSHFTGVCRQKKNRKWKARCKKRHMGYHATEEAAAKAYNIEAKRLGIALNIIPPAGVAGAGGARTGAGLPLAGAGAGAGGVPGSGAGFKRAAITSAAPAPSKMMKL